LKAEPEALAATCAHLANEKNAENIVVLNVEPLTTIADHFVILTGRNVRQLRALCAEIEHQIATLGIRPIGVEGTPQSGWMVIDFGDVIVHVFDPRAREIYDLEVLWGDAPVLDWAAARPLLDTAGR